MKLKVRKEFEYNQIGSFRNVNPYTIFWVYPKTGEAYIVKGGLNDVESFVDSHQRVPAIIHYQYFRHGSSRGGFKFTGNILSNIKINISQFNHYGKSDRAREKCSIRVYKVQPLHFSYERNSYSSKELIFEKIVKRIPRGWIKELNPYC